MSTYNKEYYLKNKDRIIANTKKWQQNNREKTRANNRQYRQKLKDEYAQLKIEVWALRITRRILLDKLDVAEKTNASLRRQLSSKRFQPIKVEKKLKLDVNDIFCIVFVVLLVAFTILVFTLW